VKRRRITPDVWRGIASAVFDLLVFAAIVAAAYWLVRG
jgi:hypothetical protein